LNKLELLEGCSDGLRHSLLKKRDYRCPQLSD